MMVAYYGVFSRVQLMSTVLSYSSARLSQACVLYLSLSDDAAVWVEITLRLSKHWPTRETHDVTISAVGAHDLQ